MSFVDQLGSNFRRYGAPASLGISIALALCFLIAWLAHSLVLVETLGFRDITHFWTVFTYPFANPGGGGEFIAVIFDIWFLLWAGGAIEGEMGTARYLIFFFLVTVLGALSVFLGQSISGVHYALIGPLIPICSLIVAWGTRNQGAAMRLYMVIPITGKWLAIFAAGLVLFLIGSGAPLIGVCALIPLAVSYAFASNRIKGIPFSMALADKRLNKAQKQRQEAYENEVRNRKQEREEREKLRKLFENSFKDDEK